MQKERGRDLFRDNNWIKPKKGKAYQAVIEQVKQQIIDGVLKPGQNLISERNLAQKLSVSRNAVREGIKTLEYLGLLDVVDGHGARVKKVDTQVIVDIWRLMLAQGQVNLYHALEIRRILESCAAELAALRRTSEDILHIEFNLARMTFPNQGPEELARCDMDFHQSVLIAARNPLLVQMVQVINSLMYEQRVIAREKGQGGRENNKGYEIYEGHREIYEAIRDGNPEAARLFSSRHIDYILERIIIVGVSGAERGTGANSEESSAIG